jgi:hypothetical protein
VGTRIFRRGLAEAVMRHPTFQTLLSPHPVPGFVRRNILGIGWMMRDGWVLSARLLTARLPVEGGAQTRWTLFSSSQLSSWVKAVVRAWLPVTTLRDRPRTNSALSSTTTAAPLIPG